MFKGYFVWCPCKKAVLEVLYHIRIYILSCLTVSSHEKSNLPVVQHGHEQLLAENFCTFSWTNKDLHKHNFSMLQNVEMNIMKKNYN